ncbi:ECF transporter S component [Cellulosilyticum ruminicola]|uniref:ECF transporter S component n=1 Tax=Cellulosilyticum ruminicola TaxID=425254 RepID=UPI0006D1C828|nr:ECF transporter S component [Cellulosilyticum ruminicola]
MKDKKLFNTVNMVKIGILGALAIVLMRTLEIPLPIFPAFLKIDFGDVPAVIATLVIHPLAGVIVVIIKNLLALFNSSTGGVGEIANVLVGIAYILPIALMTRKRTTIKNIIIGSTISIVLMMGAGMLTNALITMPLYGEQACIGMGAAINPNIVDKWTFLLYVIAPFNFVKGILVSTVSVILVKAIQPALKHLRVSRA